MKIVLTDAQTVVDQFVSADILSEFGEVVSYRMLREDEVAEAIADADIVLCNKTPMHEGTLHLAKNLRYIGLFATGYNNIDIEYCRAHGITVCNAGSYSTNAVAQQTFALILEHFNNTARYNDFVHEGKWTRSPTFSPFVFPLNELAGKTLGIVGLGAIGQTVAKIALAFEMRVLGYSRHSQILSAPVGAVIGRPQLAAEQVSLEYLLQNSDVVTVHCPLNADSAGMFDRETFAKMKPGALFVNTARGGVMVEQDLCGALESGQLGGACIDVLSTEPMAADCPLLHAKNCIMTPHIAWAPVETRQRLMRIVADNIRNYLDGTPTNVVS